LALPVTGSSTTKSHSVAGILLKRDVGMHLLGKVGHTVQVSLTSQEQQLSLYQEQRVGQTLRLLERLVWEDTYMKALLDREGLTYEDVCTTYVIAMTGPNTAMVEFVEGASTLRDVRSGKAISSGGSLFAASRTERPLFEFLRQHNPDSEEAKQATKRLAFTAAISAVLSFGAGLGDRHHENFMITPTGRLLHVDYGYALGREPLDSVLLHTLSRTQRPVTTLHFEELVDAVGESDIRNIFWPVVRGAYLRIRQHGGLMLEMVYTAMARDEQRAARADNAVARVVWKEAQEFVAGRFIIGLREPKADRFIHALLWHCSRPSVQYGNQLRDDFKNFREVGLRDKTQRAVVTAYEGVAAGGRRAASAMNGLMDASNSAKGYFHTLMQAAQKADEEEEGKKRSQIS
jgi:hypothetical protein